MAKKAAKPEPKEKVKSKAKPKAAAKVKEPVVEVDAVEAEPIVKPKKEKKPSAKAVKAAALLTAAANEANKKWNEMKEKFGKEKPANYSMSSVFEVNTAIQHKSFGWGYITANENNRLEVLFESGVRHLISNYKP